MKAVLFDLDGTLLPMDQEKYLELYMDHLAVYMSGFGYDPREFIKNIWKCTGNMVRNDGTKTNCEVFWDSFAAIYGEAALCHRNTVDDFYRKDYAKSRAACGYSDGAVRTVRSLKSRGIPLVLATSPLFPRTAIEQRITWAGLCPDDFLLVTTYENTSYSKPNPEYYANIAYKIGLDPADCVMIGNDVAEDMSAAKTGMKVFLLTDCLINTKSVSIEMYPHGSYAELQMFLSEN